MKMIVQTIVDKIAGLVFQIEVLGYLGIVFLFLLCSSLITFMVWAVAQMFM